MPRYVITLLASVCLAVVAGCTTPGGRQTQSQPQTKSTPPASSTQEPTGTTGTGSAPLDDQEIHERVHDALYRNLGDAAADISVRVEDGVVYLSGCVASQRMHDEAHDLAHGVRGVKEVNHSDLAVC